MSNRFLMCALAVLFMSAFAQKTYAQSCPEFSVPPGQADFCILAIAEEGTPYFNLCYQTDPTCQSPVQTVWTNESGGEAYFQPGTWTNWIVEPHTTYDGYGWSPTYSAIVDPVQNQWYYLDFYWLG